MAIRLRIVENTWIALCAVESDPKPGDIYLDDAQHYALATKFVRDWDSGFADNRLVALMETQEVRSAQEEMEKWTRAADAFRADHPDVNEFGWNEVKSYWESLFGSYHGG